MNGYKELIDTANEVQLEEGGIVAIKGECRAGELQKNNFLSFQKILKDAKVDYLD